MEQYRWTVLIGDQSGIDLLCEVRSFNGVSLGVLLGEAIEAWYEALPECDEDPDCLAT